MGIDDSLASSNERDDVPANQPFQPNVPGSAHAGRGHAWPRSMRGATQPNSHTPPLHGAPRQLT
jgi:hypothetical protein